MKLVRRLLGIASIAAIVVLLPWLASENAALVDLHYLLGTLSGVALWKVLLAAFGVGVAGAGALGLYYVLRLRLVARRYRKAVRGLEAEVHQLRNLPLSETEPEPDPADEDTSASAALGSAP